MSSIPGLGRSPGEDDGNPLQYSCQGNLMDRGAWWVTVLGLPGLDATERTRTDMGIDFSSPTACMNLDKVLNLSVPQLPQL